MKKILFTLVALFLSASIFAGSKLILESGSKSFVKDDAKAVFVLDLNQAVFHEESREGLVAPPKYSTICEDANKNTEDGAYAFAYAFNKRSTSLKIVTDAADAKYKIVFHLSSVEEVDGDYGSHHDVVCGKMVVTLISTNEEVCVFNVDNIKGADDYVEHDRFSKVMQKVGLALAKLTPEPEIEEQGGF